jgi:hypothetical protein
VSPDQAYLCKTMEKWVLDTCRNQFFSEKLHFATDYISNILCINTKIRWKKVFHWGIEPTTPQIRGFSNLKEQKGRVLVQKCPKGYKVIRYISGQLHKYHFQKKNHFATCHISRLGQGLPGSCRGSAGDALRRRRGLGIRLLAVPIQSSASTAQPRELTVELKNFCTRGVVRVQPDRRCTDHLRWTTMNACPVKS